MGVQAPRGFESHPRRLAFRARRAHEETTPDLDIGLEAERLHALVDGLAMHSTLAAEVTTPARQVETLSRHLDALA